MTVDSRAHRGRPDGGFTLIELVVAMGLLASFLVMLVNLIGSAARLFDEGERGQELLDRASAAMRASRDVIDATTGPMVVDRPAAPPDARLLIYRRPLGFGSLDDAAPKLPVLRATARIPAARENPMLLRAFRDAAIAEGADPQSADDDARQMLAAFGSTGRAEVLLAAWPSDETGTYFELRRGERPLDPLLLPDGVTGLLELDDPEDLSIEPERVRDSWRVVATGLLHFDLAMWSQRSRQWDASGAQGPERSWDSARAGLLTSPEPTADDFGFDVGAGSFADARDDVWPRWLRVTIVVGPPATSPPPASLARSLDATATTVTVTRPEELPDPGLDPFVKIGPEWIRFESVRGRELIGVRRGERGTRAREHGSGTAVRFGRSLQFDLRLPHGRDADD